MAEKDTNENEAAPEGGQTEPGMAPVLVQEVEHEERPNGSKADALKADDNSVPPDFADYAPERGTLGVRMSAKQSTNWPGVSKRSGLYWKDVRRSKTSMQRVGSTRR